MKEKKKGVDNDRKKERHPAYSQSENGNPSTDQI